MQALFEQCHIKLMIVTFASPHSPRKRKGCKKSKRLPFRHIGAPCRRQTRTAAGAGRSMQGGAHSVCGLVLSYAEHKGTAAKNPRFALVKRPLHMRRPRQIVRFIFTSHERVLWKDIFHPYPEAARRCAFVSSAGARPAGRLRRRRRRKRFRTEFPRWS